MSAAGERVREALDEWGNESYVKREAAKAALARLEAVVGAARTHTLRPFGRLSERDFYMLREALRALDEEQA